MASEISPTSPPTNGSLPAVPQESSAGVAAAKYPFSSTCPGPSSLPRRFTTGAPFYESLAELGPLVGVLRTANISESWGWNWTEKGRTTDEFIRQKTLLLHAGDGHFSDFWHVTFVLGRPGVSELALLASC